MVKKSRGPDHIADHVERCGYRHNYVLYYTGAVYYDLPYWTFVHLAKDAGRKESVKEMKKRNKDIEKIRQLVADGSKRWVRYDEGALLYSVGIHTFQKLAKDAKACYKVGGVTLIDTHKLDRFIEAFEMEDDD